jgi:hypothetical protein
MRKSTSNPYTGKPVCAVHLARQYAARWKSLLAQWSREKAKGRA